MVLSFSCVVSAEARESWDHDFFLERSYFIMFPVFLNVSEEYFPIIVEGSLTPNVFFYSNLKALGRRSGLAYSVLLVPRIDARMYFIYSAPVRTPSFRPMLNFQMFRQWMVTDVENRPVYGQLVTVQAIVEHYSNGQAGCFLTGEVLEGTDGEEICVFPEDYVGARTNVNKVDGSFTTNNLGFRAGTLFMTDFHGPRLTRSHEVNFTWMFYLGGRGGGIKEDQRAYYGDSQLRLRYAFEDFVSADTGLEGYFRAQVTTEYLQGAGPTVMPWSLTAELSRSFLWAGNVAPYVRLHMGHDHYNIRFDERVVMVGLGLSWTQTDRAHFD